MTISHDPNPNGESRELVIPLEPASLGEFILGLLGQRRSIDQHFHDRYFLIDLKWLLNLDDVVDQRISAQNTGTLVSFSAKIYFDDGRITNLTSRTAFRAFHDISTRVVIGLDLGWTYLIKFPNAKAPEKQEIKFRAFTDVRAAAQKPKKEKPNVLFLAPNEQKQELSFSVSFTDLTWGEDLANHMSSFILSKTMRFGWMTRLIRSLDVKAITPLVFALGMLGSLFFSERDNHSSKVLERYKVIAPENLLPLDVDQKMGFLVEAGAVLLLKSKNFVGPLIQVFALFFAVYILAWALGARKASFISFNDHSEAFFNRANHRFEVVKYGVILASLIGIVGGIFSNTIYDYLKTLHLF